MKAREEKYNDSEVRLRMVEKAIMSIEKRFDRIDTRLHRMEDKIDTMCEKLDSKIDSRFMFTIVAILTTNVLPIILHAAKLI